MADINLSVGIDTGGASKTVSALASSLNKVEAAGNKVVTSNEKVRNSIDKVSTAAKYAAELLGRYRAQLDAVAGASTGFTGASGRLRGALDSIRGSADGGGSALAGYSANLRRIITESEPLSSRLARIRADITQLSASLAAGRVSQTQYASAMMTLNSQLRSVGGSLIQNNVPLTASAAASTAAAGAANRHSGALSNNTRASYRAASANRENNAILSDQAGYWRFAARGAALYFTNLATTKLVQTNIQLESLSQSLAAVGGSQQEAAKSMMFLKDTASGLGFTVLDLGQGYKQLSAATKGTGLAGEITNAIFRTVVESSRALGLSVADTEGSLRA